MAGEIAKTEALCLDVHPWSRTSHVVTWLTPHGRLDAIVKGATRAKSAFLGQYDVNYTCEILYYLRAHGTLHPLRECTPRFLRAHLRENYRALVVAEYCRALVRMFAPMGAECAAWYRALTDMLDTLDESVRLKRGCWLATMLRFELAVLNLAGVAPDFSGYDRQAEWSSFSLETGAFAAETRHVLRIAREVAAWLDNPRLEKNLKFLLDAARVISVCYTFHLDCTLDVRRSVLGLVKEE